MIAARNPLLDIDETKSCLAADTPSAVATECAEFKAVVICGFGKRIAIFTSDLN